MTSDLSHYHNRRLTELGTGRLTWAEVAAYVKHLPAESAYKTQQLARYTDEELAAMPDDGPHGPWSRTELLLAAVFDAIGALIHVQLARAGQSTDPPPPLRRPGVLGAKRREVNPQTKAYFDAIRRKHAQQRAEEGYS